MYLASVAFRRSFVYKHKSSLESMNHSDTAGEIGSSGERGEARGAGGGPRDRPEPVAQATEIDRSRGRHVLQVGPGQSAVARPAQPEGADALRDGALDAGPPGVARAGPLG